MMGGGRGSESNATQNTVLYSGLDSVAVRTSDLRSPGHGFDSRSSRYQVITTWMGDCH